MHKTDIVTMVISYLRPAFNCKANDKRHALCYIGKQSQEHTVLKEHTAMLYTASAMNNGMGMYAFSAMGEGDTDMHANTAGEHS